ncbi:MAG: phospholipase D-like domain-containing protein [Myxococcota bacterium]|nr:phospholipase D-like domain-containing protein [Myxococcota bacterium]
MVQRPTPPVGFQERAAALVACALLLVACGDTEIMGVPADASVATDGMVEQDGSVGDDGGTEPDAGPPRPLEPSDFSRPARAALDALDVGFPAERGTAWDAFGDAVLEPGWILQTPPAEHWGEPLASLEVATCTGEGCDPDFGLRPCSVASDCTEGGTCRPVAATVIEPGESARSLCVGHSDFFYDEMYDAITRAELRVDLTSLSPPDGRFEAAIRNALTYLSRTGRPLIVRLLFGNIIGSSIDTDAVLASLTRDVDASSPITISIGAYRIGTSSWNHSKIVAVDGDFLIEGGTNLYSQHYLASSPVHDLSIQMRGPAAILAHRFANPLWEYVCEGHSVTGRTGLSTFPSSAPECPPTYDDVAPAARTGGARVIPLGRYGGLGENPADAALIAMLESAERRIDLSLQDLGPLRVAGVSIGDWPEPVLGAFGRAMARGVDVRVALSTSGSTPGGVGGSGEAYGNGWTPEDAANAQLMWLEAHPDVVPAGSTARELVCERFHVATLRASPEDVWPDGATLGNHAKYFMVDQLAFYVGSQNLYDANLAELGVIVDDPDAVREIDEQYWAPLWEQSRRVAISGADAPACSF